MDNAVTTALFLGIDGGGSHCRARLASADGRILGEGKAGAANLRLGVGKAVQEIRACTQAALQEAGLGGMPLQALHAGVGLAGAMLEGDAALVGPIRDLFAACTLGNDAYIACLGAHQGGQGGILIVGTGSCAQIISQRESRTFGGWGFHVADQASGACLGREAIRLALLALEHILPQSPMTLELNAHFGQRPENYLGWSLEAKPADYAAFAPLVFRHAGQLDLHALNIVAEAAGHVTRVVRLLEQYQTGSIALLGGLAAQYPRYLPEETLQLLSAPQGDALDGALWLARLAHTGQQGQGGVRK